MIYCFVKWGDEGRGGGGGGGDSGLRWVGWEGLLVNGIGQ